MIIGSQNVKSKMRSQQTKKKLNLTFKLLTFPSQLFPKLCQE